VINSTSGKGSDFLVYLPLTLAIIDGLLIKTGNERYIVPTLSVRESLKPQKSMISTLHEKGEMINVRGHLIPILKLHELFDIKPKVENIEDSIAIIIDAGHAQRCLIVDDLIGKQEVVIKNMNELFKKNRTIAGAAILGDGQVGLILDANTLVNLDLNN
jgi:two-component system chemotaxis sensor kinase CheA